MLVNNRKEDTHWHIHQSCFGQRSSYVAQARCCVLQGQRTNGSLDCKRNDSGKTQDVNLSIPMVSVSGAMSMVSMFDAVLWISQKIYCALEEDLGT